MTMRIRWVLLFLSVFYAIRLYLIGTMELAPDEAFYWYWAKHPDLGYLDHPPMVAYLMAIFTAMGGDTAFFVRIGGLLCTVLAHVCIFLTVRRLEPEKQNIAWELLLVINCTLLFSAGCLVQTPDTPLLLFWSLTLYCGACIATGGGYGWWLLSGVTIGLGLMSKYTMVLIIPCQFLFLLFSSDMRRWLRHPAPYLALVIALVIFSPVIYWNWQHDWASFGFQLDQGFSYDNDPLYAKMGEYLGGQLGVVTPLLFLAFIFYSVKAVTVDIVAKRLHFKENRELFLACLAWPVVFFFGFSTAVGDVAEANWPAPAYISGLMLTWIAFRRRYADKASHRRFMKIAVGLGLVVNLALHVHLVSPFIPIAPDNDNTRQFHGWRGLGTKLNAIIEENPSPRGYFLIANRLTSVAETVFYTGNRSVGIHLFDMGEYTFLKDLERLKGKDAVIVLHYFAPGLYEKCAPFFESLSVVGNYDNRFRDTTIEELSATILIGTHFKGIPAEQ